MALIRRARSEPDWPQWFPARRLFDWPESWRELWEDEGTMRIEEFQEGDALVLRAELPGIDPDKDVEITLSDHTLRIRAERREETRTEGKKGYRSEFRYGSFMRTVPLPAGTAEQDVKASYTDGILEVRVPISPEQAAAKKIPVTKGGGAG